MEAGKFLMIFGGGGGGLGVDINLQAAIMRTSIR